MADILQRRLRSEPGGQVCLGGELPGAALVALCPAQSALGVTQATESLSFPMALSDPVKPRVMR